MAADLASPLPIVTALDRREKETTSSICSFLHEIVSLYYIVCHNVCRWETFWTAGLFPLLHHLPQCLQVGDILDRGDNEVQICYFLERLQAQALHAGGKLHVLNGK